MWEKERVWTWTDSLELNAIIRDSGSLKRRLRDDSYHRDREARSDHDNVMQDHEELSPEITTDCRSLGFGAVVHLVPFDLELVPVTQEHGVDVIHKVRHRKPYVGAGQPVSEKE